MRTRADTPDETEPEGSHGELVDALLTVTRVIVAMAARSLANLDADVTLPQYRALVVLAARGPQRVMDISAELGVNPSTGTRMCDRLVKKGLVTRCRSTADRRALRLALTPAGQRLVHEVTLRRRKELDVVADGVPPAIRRQVTEALRALATRSGELPETEWFLGWHEEPASE